MATLISKNKEGGVYVVSDSGEIFCIVSSLEILKEGSKIAEDTFTVLEDKGFELEQDFDKGVTYIDLRQVNGEIARLIFSENEMDIVEA